MPKEPAAHWLAKHSMDQLRAILGLFDARPSRDKAGSIATLLDKLTNIYGHYRRISTFDDMVDAMNTKELRAIAKILGVRQAATRDQQINHLRNMVTSNLRRRRA